jgi:hypothetical protein
MKWVVTAHRDWQRLDVAQFEIEAETRDDAIELAKQQLAACSVVWIEATRDEATKLAPGTVAWIAGEPVKHDEGFVVTPGEEDSHEG